jgi:chromosome segregation ATPase
MSVSDRPDEHTAAWWRQQYLAVCYQQNVYAASIRDLEIRIANLADRIDPSKDQLQTQIHSMSVKLGEVSDRLDRASRVVGTQACSLRDFELKIKALQAEVQQIRQTVPAVAATTNGVG